MGQCLEKSLGLDMDLSLLIFVTKHFSVPKIASGFTFDFSRNAPPPP